MCQRPAGPLHRCCSTCPLRTAAGMPQPFPLGPEVQKAGCVHHFKLRTDTDTPSEAGKPSTGCTRLHAGDCLSQPPKSWGNTLLLSPACQDHMTEELWLTIQSTTEGRTQLSFLSLSFYYLVPGPEHNIHQPVTFEVHWPLMPWSNIRHTHNAMVKNMDFRVTGTGVQCAVAEPL